MGAVFCGIGQAWAGEYQVTVEYSLPPLYSTASMTLNGTGSFTDPGSGSPILTIDLGSATINYLPGVIFGSFNGISLSYAGSTGEITGDWDVTNSFNPSASGPVTIPLDGGGDISAWDQVTPLTGGPSAGQFDDPSGELNILSWTVEDLDGPDNPPTGQPYIQLNSNAVYALSGSSVFNGPLPSTTISSYEYPQGPGVWQPQGFLGRDDAHGCSLKPMKAPAPTTILTGMGEEFSQYAASLT